jgi:hypothetical protein
MATATATAIRSKVVLGVLGVIWDRDWGGGPHMGMFAAAIEGVDGEGGFVCLSPLSASSDAMALGRGVPALAVGDRTSMIGRTGIIEF